MPHVTRLFSANDEVVDCIWNIDHSVGVGGRNDELDVMLVQFLLNRALRRCFQDQLPDHTS